MLRTSLLQADGLLAQLLQFEVAGLPEWVVGLSPALVMIVAAMVLFMADAIDPDTSSHGTVAGITLAGVFAAFSLAAAQLAAGVEPASFLADQLVVDHTSLLFTLIVTTVTSLVVIASYDYLEALPDKAEFYSLVLLAATGMVTMAHSNSLVTVFIALELSSLPSYALVSFLKHNRGSVEAGLKYFLIGALSSAIFVYGISLVYAATGTLLLPDVAAALGDVEQTGVLGIGVLMIVAGIGFKIAGVPFHFWAPEAYEGAAAPASAFLSSASKAAGFVIAFRVFTEAFPIAELQATVDWVLVFGVIAVLTMLLGNLAAAVQDNVKRMLAYSSVAHAGYVLIALAALSSSGSQNDLVLAAGILHLFVYGFMNTGAFLFVALGEYWEVGRTFEDYAGLAREAPIACAAVTLLVFSLAGLPVGGGFWSKFALFYGAIGNGFWWLVVVGGAGSAMSLYYYARLVKTLWIEEPTQRHDVGDKPIGLYTAILTAAVVTVLLLVPIATDVVMDSALEGASVLLE